MTSRRKVGILGGTFDPLHIGHLHIALCARHVLGLDEALVMPAGSPPHKPDERITSGGARLEMIRAAIEGIEGLGCSDLDLHGNAPSYTSDLLEKFRAQHPDTDLWFIIGSDSLHEFHTWHRPNRILEFTRLAVAERPGWPVGSLAEQPDVPELSGSVDRFATVPLDLSSTIIRRRVAHGLPIDWLVPPRLLNLIQETGIYLEGSER